MILTHGANSLPRKMSGMTVTIGGRDYPVVQIGSQLWMAENLDYAWDVLPIGNTSAPQATVPQANYYNDDAQTYGVNGLKYGLLYNPAAGKYLNSHRNTLLPEGWHLPSKSEYETLIAFIGDASTAGYHLKSISGWKQYVGNDGNGDNSVGFNAMPAGERNYSGRYGGIGEYVELLTSSPFNDTYQRYFQITYRNQEITNTYNDVSQISIRLVKDA